MSRPIFRPARSRCAFVCGSAQWALAVAVQIGNIVESTRAAHGDWHSALLLVARLPILQTQNVLVAALFGLLAWLAAGSRIASWTVFGIFCAESVAVVLDGVYYKTFLDHVRPGAFEGGRQINFGILTSSFAGELDWIVFVEAAVALVGAIWLARTQRSNEPSGKPFRYAAALAAILALMGVPAYSSRQYRHINEHPLVALAQDALRPRLGKAIEPDAAILLSSFHSDQPDDVDPKLAAIAAAGAKREARPNILLIVMESVGAVSLLGPDGLPDARFAPNLAALAQRGVVFDSLYTTYPGTTRSLITLHTGGRQPTWGDADEFRPRYQGPALPRSFAALGYRAAFFSSERMDGEGSDLFLSQIGFAKYYDFSQDPNAVQPRFQIHSWGAREDYTTGLIEDWIAQASRPFLLEYMTAATHHPYGAPAGYPAPLPGGTAKNDFLNALHYSDHAIGGLIGFLRDRGLLDNTIVAVTGDHGEAFADRHPDNLIHNGFDYDENIRDFLLIHDGQLASRAVAGWPLVSHRVGGAGDIMPTLLAVAGAPPADVPGRSLLAERFDSRPVFFHKMAYPETWGLRDGRWKYIGEIRDGGTAALYDIAADPLEHQNVAAAQPARCAKYQALCREWFARSERDYRAHLAGADGAEETRQANAPRMQVGYWDQSLGCFGSQATGYSCQSGSFTEKATLGPGAIPMAVTTWSLDPDPAARYEWVSPGGQRLQSALTYGREYHTTSSQFPGRPPLQPGGWTVELRAGNRVLESARFSVK